MSPLQLSYWKVWNSSMIFTSVTCAGDPRKSRDSSSPLSPPSLTTPITFDPGAAFYQGSREPEIEGWQSLSPVPFRHHRDSRMKNSIALHTESEISVGKRSVPFFTPLYLFLGTFPMSVTVFSAYPTRWVELNSPIAHYPRLTGQRRTKKIGGGMKRVVI